MRATRPVSWLTAARRAFDGFPEGARETILDALSVAAEGGMAAIAKPMKGLGSGIFEIALPYRGNAFRVVYAVQPLEKTCGSCMRFKRNPRRASRRRSAKSI
jgi:phage-related protein